MIKWGIMSTSSIADKFAQAVNKMESDIIITAVASRTEKKAMEFAQKYDIPAYYGSYEQLCKDDNVDVIYICTPNAYHFSNAMMCLENSKHVLCEKPFTIDVDDAFKLYNEAKERNLFIMEGFWIKHLPLLNKMREIIESGKIGQVIHMRAEYGFIAGEERKNSKFNPSLGGGALLDIGVYNIGFARMVMKDSPISIKSNVIKNDYGTDKFSTMILEYPNQRTASITTAIGIEIPTEAVIYGSEGRIYFPNYQKAEKMEIILYNGTKCSINMPFEINGFEYQIREVKRCIEAGMNTSDRLTMKDTTDVLQTMDYARNFWKVAK